MIQQFRGLTGSLAGRVKRRQAIKTFGLGLAGLGLARFGVHQAHAITNGDLDGDAHPNVGGFVWRNNIWSPDPPPVFIGTGTLIHPQIVLTAGHGTYAVESAVKGGSMTMDDLLISFAGDASDPVTWRPISAVVTHPGYFDPPEGNGAPLIDIGVAILETPVTDLPLMPLAPAGFLDELEELGALHSGADRARFTVVGYGSVLGEKPNQIVFPPDGSRRSTESAFDSLRKRWLYLDTNQVRDLGGTAAGDSGGPALWQDPSTGESIQVAVTSRGSLYLDSKSRVDTWEALDFLNQIMTRVDA